MRGPLTEQEEEIAFEMGIAGDTLVNTAKILGFSSNMEFYTYRLKHPDFSKALDHARNAGSGHMEDEMRHILDTEKNAHRARVKMEILSRLLAYRDPAKYGNRVDVNINQTVDIGSSLARMNARLDAAYRDVVPVLELQKPNEIKDLL